MENISLLKYLPAVDNLLEQLMEQQYALPREYLVQVIRDELDHLRQDILSEKFAGDEDAVKTEALERIKSRCESRQAGSMQSVINATGIVLHTGLGRAPLSESAREALEKAASGYVNLEFDLDSGTRGERNDHIEDLLCAVTGAEAGLLVNNNAAAVLLALNTLASGGESIISRGQLVEIGGSFRIPDVMAKSGTTMVEIGTTNRTHLQDYTDAITDQTRIILIAHTSNYKIEGFTKSPALKDLVELGQNHNIPLMYDLGSGALFDMERLGLPRELVVSEIIDAGVDVVTFSGDKLIGGPQSGLIVGTKALIDQMKKNPMTRALRCDKLIYASMEATLQSYISPAELPSKNRTYELLTRSPGELHTLAEAVLEGLPNEVPEILDLQLMDAPTEAGSGSLPTEQIPGIALVIQSSAWSPNRIMHWMRNWSAPIIGYISHDQCYFNLRTILPDQIKELQTALENLAGDMNR